MKRTETAGPSVPGIIAGIVIVVALITDAILVFGKLQNADSGEFDITGLASVNWTFVAIVTVVALVISAALHVVSKKVPQKANGNA